jgi:hypothetical protein
LAVKPLAAGSRLALGQKEQLSVAPNPANESGVSRKIFQQFCIGKTTIDHHPQMACSAL